MLVDTHCHIHSTDYPLDNEVVLNNARSLGVSRLICVGTDDEDSRLAVDFASKHSEVWASIGLHPHDATKGLEGIETLATLASDPHVVAIGECGLDYFYENSSPTKQADMLHAQLEIATRHNLPAIFHVREAFDDFWPIFEQYPSIQGVLHSFTDTMSNLEKALSHNLYIGVNGISTFTKNPAQKEMFAAIPLKKLLLETDAPYLTPAPLRGKVNEPAFVTHVAAFHADLRTLSLKELSAATSKNATTLFKLKPTTNS